MLKFAYFCKYIVKALVIKVAKRYVGNVKMRQLKYSRDQKNCKNV